MLLCCQDSYQMRKNICWLLKNLIHFICFSFRLQLRWYWFHLDIFIDLDTITCARPRCGQEQPQDAHKNTNVSSI